MIIPWPLAYYARNIAHISVIKLSSSQNKLWIIVFYIGVLKKHCGVRRMGFIAQNCFALNSAVQVIRRKIPVRRHLSLIGNKLKPNHSMQHPALRCLYDDCIQLNFGRSR